MGFLQQLLYALNNQGYGNYMMNQMPMNAYAGSPYNSMGSFGGISSLYQPSNFMGGFNGISSLYQPFSSRYSFGGGGGNMFQPYQPPMYQPYQGPSNQPLPTFARLASGDMEGNITYYGNPNPVESVAQQSPTDSVNKAPGSLQEAIMRNFKPPSYNPYDGRFLMTGGMGPGYENNTLEQRIKDVEEWDAQDNMRRMYQQPMFQPYQQLQQPQQLTDEQRRQMFRQARIFKKSTI
jgi:hypothetical protein